MTRSGYELSVGLLAFLPGSREIMLTSTDPINSYSAGIVWLNNEKGNQKRALKIISELNNIIIGAPVQFGKSLLGHVNMVCAVSPLEIGNRLWRDDNGNRIQDAGELGIENVIIHLVNVSNQIVGRDTADINGVCAFNHFNVVDTLGISKPNRLGPQPKISYNIQVKGKVGTAPALLSVAKKKSPLLINNDLHTGTLISPTNRIATNPIINNGGILIDDAVLGNQNAGTGPFQDLIDSDGIINGADGSIVATTGEIG